MRTITPEIFKAYQALNPQDEKLQSLTLEELYKETGSGQVDWNQITYKPSPPELQVLVVGTAQPVLDTLSLTASACS